MGKTSSTVITFAVILNTLVLAASLWLIIKSAQLREHDKAVNLVLPKVLNMWAYDAFATFGSLAMILVGIGYAIICCCRDTFLNIQIGILVLFTCVSGYILWPLLEDYERLERASRGEVSAIGESIGTSIFNILSNANSK